MFPSWAVHWSDPERTSGFFCPSYIVLTPWFTYKCDGVVGGSPQESCPPVMFSLRGLCLTRPYSPFLGNQQSPCPWECRSLSLVIRLYSMLPGTLPLSTWPKHARARVPRPHLSTCWPGPLPKCQGPTDTCTWIPRPISPAPWWHLFPNILKNIYIGNCVGILV